MRVNKQLVMDIVIGVLGFVVFVVFLFWLSLQ